MQDNLRIIGPRDATPLDAVVVNTTSTSKTWSRGLSPFFLGPVDLYAGFTAHCVENAWQFSKVYREHINEDSNPSMAYWDWARAGWANTAVQRYPMGKEAKPEYAFWEGRKLGYIDARREIYIPLYAASVAATPAFTRLQELYRQTRKQGIRLYLWDFDGYDNVSLGMSLTRVRDSDHQKMGHAFVLAGMLSGDADFMGYGR